MKGYSRSGLSCSLCKLDLKNTLATSERHARPQADLLLFISYKSTCRQTRACLAQILRPRLFCSSPLFPPLLPVQLPPQPETSVCLQIFVVNLKLCSIVTITTTFVGRNPINPFRKLFEAVYFSALSILITWQGSTTRLSAALLGAKLSPY